MGFAFLCSDGWFQILWDLSNQLERLITSDKQYASIVKEKMGSLRFYMYGSTEAMDDAIYEAETRSAEICEICGELSKIVCREGWFTTECAACNSSFRLGGKI
jgi:hypothetical protein